MRVSLRDRIRSQSVFTSSEDPLVRLAAVYHLSRQTDSERIRERLLRLIASQDEHALHSNDLQTILFSLHTAVILAQRNNFEGIEWILRLFRSTSNRDIKILAETALRNCSQFPLAVLLSKVMELETEESIERTEALMRISEDELFVISQKSEQEQDGKLSEILDSLHRLTKRPGREIAVATVLSRPALKDFGYRYTGFLSVPREPQGPLVIPYDLADVLNRDDRLSQSTSQLLRQPGRRALVVYDVGDDREAQVLYVLPFAIAPAGEMDGLLTELAVAAEGIDVAVVVERWKEGNGDKYRLITASGQALVRRYRAEDQQIGNCFFLHKHNGEKPLSTRFKLSTEGILRVAGRFAENTEMDLATRVFSDHRNGRNLLVSSGGETFVRQGDYPAKGLYAVQETQRGGFPFRLPGEWPTSIRTKVLIRYLEVQPEAYGVILEVGQGDDGKSLARIVQANTGITFRQPTDNRPLPGTLALLRQRDEERLAATILDGYRIEGGCRHCFGAYFRMCPVCDGGGSITCTDCNGTKKVDCPDCEDGTTDCGKCDGGGTYYLECTKCTNGYWRDGRTCPKCEGSGQFGVTCHSCQGSGEWDCSTCHGRATAWCDCGNGRQTCYECDGYRVSRCGCQANQPGRIVEKSQ